MIFIYNDNCAVKKDTKAWCHQVNSDWDQKGLYMNDNRIVHKLCSDTLLNVDSTVFVYR